MNETPTTQKLAEHAAEIRRLAKRSIGDVIEIGRHLTEARKILKGHNQWMAWLKDELGWSPQTAGRLIQVFELSLKHSNLESANLPLSAYYILAAPSAYPPAVSEVLALASKGVVTNLAQVREITAAASAVAALPAPRRNHLDYVARVQPKEGKEGDDLQRYLLFSDLEKIESAAQALHSNINGLISGVDPATAADVVARLISVIDMLQAVATAAEIFHSPLTIVAPDEGTPG